MGGFTSAGVKGLVLQALKGHSTSQWEVLRGGHLQDRYQYFSLVSPERLAHLGEPWHGAGQAVV
jgi:hypothetical protein